MPEDVEPWYVVKLTDGRCQVVPQSAIRAETREPTSQIWGPYPSQGEAIARRVGLIRALKCQPD